MHVILLAHICLLWLWSAMSFNSQRHRKKNHHQFWFFPSRQHTRTLAVNFWVRPFVWIIKTSECSFFFKSRIFPTWTQTQSMENQLNLLEMLLLKVGDFVLSTNWFWMTVLFGILDTLLATENHFQLATFTIEKWMDW